MSVSPQMLQQRATEREGMNPEYRSAKALEQMADALEFIKHDMMDIKAVLTAMLQKQR